MALLSPRFTSMSWANVTVPSASSAPKLKSPGTIHQSLPFQLLKLAERPVVSPFQPRSFSTPSVKASIVTVWSPP